MKRLKNVTLRSALLLLVCLLALGQTVYAAPQEAPAGEISLPVDIRAEGFLPDEPEVYTLVLEGEEARDSASSGRSPVPRPRPFLP